MAHQRHLEKEKYRQWVKAGLGLTYLREGISPFCDDIAKQQHKEILDKIEQTNKVSKVACGQCSWTTLRPDHAKGGNRSCKLGQRNCICCNPAGKITCPNEVCGAIYDEIVKKHGSTPPAPYWKNTEPQHWCTDPWSIAKCFINAPGYEKKASAADIDCIGLLHLIRNNLYFHNYIQCTINKTDIFSKVIADRNEIFHSSTMELEETEANSYIDDMIAVLQDGKELNNRQDAKDAVKKLEELKNKDFIITTENEAQLLRDVAEEIRDMLETFENKTEDLATKEECDRLKKQLSELKKEMKRLKAYVSSQQEPLDYEQSKLELQTMLIKHYREDILRMAVLPQQQEDNMIDFKDVYVRPRMMIESKDESDNKPKVTDMLSMSDIFTIDSKPIKSIYVLGEAGCGKSSFCKSLVNYWCLAHSEEVQSIEDEFSGVKEMKKFNFLFLLPLRHYTDKIKIKEMLEEEYEHPALKKLLDCESRTCLVVLDGLDEWAPPPTKRLIKSPPKRDSLKDYTVITTSRPWKIESLGITDYEIRQKIIITGIDDTSIKMIIKSTVPLLNKTFTKNKNSIDCEKALENKSVASLTHTAITLQQLICLWYDNKLRDGISRCALYTEMLDLFFDWNEKKCPEDPLSTEMINTSESLKNVQLPLYLTDNEFCKSYSHIIHEVSRLAYETLFNNMKETSLTFDSSTFEQLKISEKVNSCCLKLGILTESKCQSLCASRSRKSVTAFVHKSFQEYLAAVYIAIKFNADVSSAGSENVYLSDKCAAFIQRVFSNCTTLDETLEQANVFIMLCGLEPRIATSVSKYIAYIVTRDKRVLQYRRTIDDEYRHRGLISTIQGCIINCIEEVQACQTRIQCNFYLGDILVTRESLCGNFCSNLEQYISPDSVISLRINTFNVEMNLERVWNFLQKCQHIEAMYINYWDSSKIDDEDIKTFCHVIEGNTSTLKSLYVDFNPENDMKHIHKTIVRRLSDMSHLVALKIHFSIIPQEDFTSLCTFLSDSSHLEQISICGTTCEVCSYSSKCRKQHEVNLSKHQQLQYLEYDNSMTRVNTSSLEIFEYLSLENTTCEKVFDILSTANKLTELYLQYDTRSYNKPSYHTVADKLIALLPLLPQLRKLTLSLFTFTDNIMKCPSEMKNMEIIYLRSVRMSLTTWQQFVDSLPLIPLPVNVIALGMCITRDGEEYEPGMFAIKGGKEAAALLYVREQEELFNVEYEHETSHQFSTRK
ncbi:uncharacterized protein LOC123522836 [Mercenaria mercenaria]|uniref:uncharacterized protein LOC123522836 n=1 Tax=Mercenaria mercenaria TaxID=6596 RepID=UPI00234F2EC1|nr:uncharacterized protein LOC123522836 [Mercenaria mercenaria]XP_045156236.2 uncharacterized protein LOC123522836 [Mercenaria mercenaria]XP_053405547.1 uncharacterized protein LOC123522836 [Mercenaria mercenaria]